MMSLMGQMVAKSVNGNVNWLIYKEICFTKMILYAVYLQVIM